MKIGCHAVLFKDKIASDNDTVLSNIKNTGFQGTEIGARFFGTEKKDYLLAQLEKYKVEMSGMHAVVFLTEIVDNKESAIGNVMKVVNFVKDMPNKNVVLTGMHKQQDQSEMDARLKDKDFVIEVAKGLNELALRAKEVGARINYHNHGWEFENDALIFKALGEYAPDLDFGLDTGWAFSMGYEPVELMEQYPNRFHYVHLRDYNSETKEFGELGEGSQDYDKMMVKLKQVLGPDDWAVVEYETGEEDYTRYSRAYDFIKKYL